MVKVAESILKKVEKEHLDGITSADLLAFFAGHGIRFGEATLRKWVQLGLLPRSIRVGQKGKHQGSKGKYPVRVIRRILHIKELMARDVTIELILRHFLFVRGDIEALEHGLDRIFDVLDQVVKARDASVPSTRAVGIDLGKAKSLAGDLVDRLERIEGRLVDDSGDQNAEATAS